MVSDDQEDHPDKPLSISEILTHDCPYYMAIGMTYEQYWYGDPLMVRAFYKAKKIQDRRKDEEAWLQGAYVLKALQATVGNMFLKKGSAPFEYPEQPFTFEEMQEEEAREKTEREQEQEKLWAEAWMMSFVEAGKQWEKKG